MRRMSCIQDMALRAKRRIPAFAWGYLDGGSGEEGGLRRNRDRLEAVLLKPRFCTGVRPDTSAALFDVTYAQPFGIAPVGMGGLMWPGADLALAALAKAGGIPMVASTVSSTALEDIAQAAGGNAWFQLYASRQPRINRDLMDRAWAAGIRVMAVTVDVPLAGDRRRDVRNRFILPFRPGLRFAWDVATHPAWALATLRHGSPGFPNLARYSGDVDGQTLTAFISSQIKDDLSWDDIRDIRQTWPGKLLVKGILAPENAAQALAIGADGVWVSNHGGRQQDSAPAAIDALAAVRSVVAGDAMLVMDSGLRSGEDMARARVMGADFVFAGRPFYYGAAAGGAAGAARAVELLSADLKRILAQLGCPSWRDLDRRWLWDGRDSPEKPG
ncbi:alpha-hydroxy-acid oxidizing enzyme [Paramagnetospirillum marisnigri]|uniref:Alpha-hydroxy-acid oxidizing enzyme n=1 Tax=Paramagnetospirillum marisnigri TaxID=1285242 RepID=A0A178MH22_9PROT|nr:alpha-hydroxy acid oxidase [Paramagnetospirillum marisnigri]OAN47990.1 alpha-hydroxy-acid oxidizing enzyme [Paramagnetospirillum marisnigri]